MANTQLVILDRDGVINKDSAQFVKSPDEWVILPGAASAIARLTEAGYTVAVASNQSGLGRGYFDRPALYAMHRKMRRDIGAAGGRIDRVVVCPHLPNDGCTCRKPKPGLLHRLGRYYRTSLNGVPIVGDSQRDLQAAVAVGAWPILVRTGNGAKTEATGKAGAADVVDDLAGAAELIIRRGRR